MTLEQRPRRPWDRTPPAEREYFEILGDGLMAVVPPKAPGAGSGWSPPNGGAWLHVGPDGLVRAFTGKADVGQGTRLALAGAVAGELRAPLDRVELVMADTDLCPYDIGTFGSRSMVDVSPALRRAAAGARRWLLARAAGEGVGEPEQLEAADGRVTARAHPEGRGYGDLVRGLREVVVVPPETPLGPAAQWRPAGPSEADPRGLEVVTGARQFVSDVRRPGMLYGTFLQPPRYGARLVGASTRRARARPGVVVVEDGEFVGVAARSPGEARAALGEIEADWVLSAQPTEGEIETFLRTHPSRGDSWDTAEHHVGDAERALAAAPVRREAVYRTAYIAHVPLETHAAVAEWQAERVTIWVGTQTPFRARAAVAGSLGLSEDDVRVIVPFTGAGFGGKHGGEIALAAAKLARGAGAPVRVVFSREEEFRHAYFRPMAIVDVRAGATRGGRLQAWTFHNVNAGAAALIPPYTIPNQAVDNELSDSPLPQDPYRALAANANNFARESMIDELAHDLAIDPLTFRVRNLRDDRLLAVLRTAATAAGWPRRARRPGKGYGLAIGLEKGGRVATVAEVTVAPDRALTVDRLVVAYEAGTIVHPANLRSQVEGATVMALGGALFEAIHFGNGKVVNDRLSTYRVPRFSDLPALEVHLLDRPDLPPAGAGETPMIAVAPAVANAIFDATGCRLRALPLVPDGKVPPAEPPARTTARASRPTSVSAPRPGARRAPRRSDRGRTTRR